jgi:hypothetical protein
VLVALDGLKVNAGNLDKLLARRLPGEEVEIHAFRRDELMHFAVSLQEAPRDTAKLSLVEEGAAPLTWRSGRPGWGAEALYCPRAPPLRLGCSPRGALRGSGRGQAQAEGKPAVVGGAVQFAPEGGIHLDALRHDGEAGGPPARRAAAVVAEGFGNGREALAHVKLPAHPR